MTLRMPVTLADELKDRARADDRSLNTYVLRVLIAHVADTWTVPAA